MDPVALDHQTQEIKGVVADMSNEYYAHIKTTIDRILLSQILFGNLVSKPYFEYGETDLESEAVHLITNDLYQKNSEEWLTYEVKSNWTGQVYKIRARQIILNYSLWDGTDDVSDLHSEMVVQMELDV